MNALHPGIVRWSQIGRQGRAALVVVLTLVVGLLCGCAAVTNPVSDGIPVHLLSPELRGESKASKQTIPLTLLRQCLPEVYRLGPGDILGVYIEGILGDRRLAPEVVLPQGASLLPGAGSAVPVRENGTLPLPLIRPVPVEGLTIGEAEDAIIQAYTAPDEILKREKARSNVHVTLLRPRMSQVVVLRQDSPGGYTGLVQGQLRTARLSGGAESFLPSGARGSAAIVELPAYENDVLGALVRTGGLPGLEAINEVIVERGCFDVLENPAALAQHVPGRTPGRNFVRIPLRLCPGEPIPFSPEDVVLHTGDIVFIEARKGDVFYTAGLLPAGAYPLPRDYDLDVVDAVAAIGGPMVNGAFGGNNLQGSIVQPGIGFPSPSLLTVLRQTPCGQMHIRVDLNRALRDRRESLLVQAGDVLILQETPGEATARYFTHVFGFDFLGKAITGDRSAGNVTAVLP
jgi:protein involved in polysaccharide export with SLBB domain